MGTTVVKSLPVPPTEQGYCNYHRLIPVPNTANGWMTLRCRASYADHDGNHRMMLAPGVTVYFPDEPVTVDASDTSTTSV